MKFFRRAAACAFLLSLLSSGVASADDARSIDVARRSYSEGLQQYKSNDVEGARLSFAQSYAAWPAIETLKSLAIAELDTGHFLDALKHFKAYAKDRNADAEFLKKVPGFIARCNEHVGHVRIVAPAGAAILVDGRRVFDMREPLDVMPGSHTVTLREPLPAETRTVNVAVTQTIDVTFSRDVAPSAGPTAPAPVDPDGSSDGQQPESSFWTTRNKWAVGLGAGGVAAVAVGAVFGVAAMNEHSTYKDLAATGDSAFCAESSTSDYCTQLSSKSRAQRFDAHASTVAFGVGGALLVGSIVLFVWPKGDDRRSGRVWIAPALGGVLAGGHF